MSDNDDDDDDVKCKDTQDGSVKWAFSNFDGRQNGGPQRHPHPNPQPCDALPYMAKGYL